MTDEFDAEKLARRLRFATERELEALSRNPRLRPLVQRERASRAAPPPPPGPDGHPLPAPRRPAAAPSTPLTAVRPGRGLLPGTTPTTPSRPAAGQPLPTTPARSPVAQAPAQGTRPTTPGLPGLPAQPTAGTPLAAPLPDPRGIPLEGDKIIDIPGVGTVTFPGHMADEEIALVIQNELLAPQAQGPLSTERINSMGPDELRSLAPQVLSGELPLSPAEIAALAARLEFLGLQGR